MLRCLVVGLLVLAGSFPVGSFVPATAGPRSTRTAAARADFNWGAAARPSLLERDPGYAQALADNFTVITPENALKFDTVHPAPDRYDFGPGDRLADFARAHGMKMRGHTLVWHAQLPDWVTRETRTRDQWIGLMRDHIVTVLGHYRSAYPDVFYQWDVVNEAFDGRGERRPSVWQKGIGDDYVELAFRFAREAWPGMQLFYNDFDDGTGESDCDRSAKCAAIKRLATRFRSRSVPLDGIGFQGHIKDLDSPDFGSLAGWVERLGLRWAITELDMTCTSARPPQVDRPACFASQARAFGAAVRACVDSPACDTVVQWGVSDRDSWLNRMTYDPSANPLAFDRQFGYKPAAYAVVKELSG